RDGLRRLQLGLAPAARDPHLSPPAVRLLQVGLPPAARHPLAPGSSSSRTDSRPRVRLARRGNRRSNSSRIHLPSRQRCSFPQSPPRQAGFQTGERGELAVVPFARIVGPAVAILRTWRSS